MITKEIGNREGEASCHGNLGAAFHSLGEYEKAQEYFEKALAMGKEIGNRKLEASCYENLGTVFRSLGEYGKARKYYNEALGISKDIENVEAEIRIQANLAFSNVMEGDTEETLSNLLVCVNKFENMRGLIKKYDELKIFLSDEHATPFRILSEVLCAIGNPTEALCVEELRRDRALAELLSAKSCVESQVSGNPLSWVDIERIIGHGKKCLCLYISYFSDRIFLWVLKPAKATLSLRQIDVGELPIKDLSKFLGSDITFRKFQIPSEKHCEDRSLFPSENEGELTQHLHQKQSVTG